MNMFLNFNTKELTLFVYMVIINFISFIVFGVDKSKSQKNQWRIKESTLIVLSLLGGSIGSMIGMIVFHHKLNKKKFYIGIPLIFILNKVIEILLIVQIR